MATLDETGGDVIRSRHRPLKKTASLPQPLLTMHHFLAAVTSKSYGDAQPIQCDRRLTECPNLAVVVVDEVEGKLSIFNVVSLRMIQGHTATLAATVVGYVMRLLLDRCSGGTTRFLQESTNGRCAISTATNLLAIAVPTAWIDARKKVCEFSGCSRRREATA